VVRIIDAFGGPKLAARSLHEGLTVMTSDFVRSACVVGISLGVIACAGREVGNSPTDGGNPGADAPAAVASGTSGSMGALAGDADVTDALQGSGQPEASGPPQESGPAQSTGTPPAGQGGTPDAQFVQGVDSASPSPLADKLDLLFDIDNSASMGDKQQYLTQAIPDLIDRLVNPNCVDINTGAVTGKSMAGQGCAQGSKSEFAPVHNMHLGVVTSSLGPRLSEPDPVGVCNEPTAAPPPFLNIDSHNDDHGHLIARSLAYTQNGAAAAEGVVQDAVVAAYGMPASGFLWWYPGANPPPGVVPAITQTMQLEHDFGSIVAGAGVFGCGIESQLESWYRFLVQPDPYMTLVPNMNQLAQGRPTAAWQDVDSVILQQRHDFLRPDSLVAVIVLSDENDSEIDVRSIGGLGYLFMQTTFRPPHSTTPCATNPLAAGCHSCSPGDVADPACAPSAGSGLPIAQYTSPNDWGYYPNVRHVHMRAKYGLDPQFPIERYVLGLTNPMVPNRAGEYPAGATNYAGLDPKNLNCTNPLYAAALPDGTKTDANTLCNLPAGPRTKDLVFYAHIGGVPHQLLHFKPADPMGSQLTDADWTRILGKDPEHFDYTGIDPHMIEDYKDRTATTVQVDTTGTNPLSPATAAGMPDPVTGREWVTNTEMTAGGHVFAVDREYACTFALPAARDCTLAQNQDACDCPSRAGLLTHDQLSPVCDDNVQTKQVAAKAYPTIRELLLARLMGAQGIVSSICPIHVTDQMGGTDPLYGYRPAVSALIERIRLHLK
jgi:hypothetical protein